jgi:hypothetical protein
MTVSPSSTNPQASRDFFKLADESTMAKVPAEFFLDREDIPVFWKSSIEQVNAFLDEQIQRGQVTTIGTTAGGRPIRAVFYGTPRQGRGTTTFSGSLGCKDVSRWIGPDHDKKVGWIMSGEHGGEFEGIMASVNLLNVIETGGDLRGTPQPELQSIALELDRLIVIPIVNMDGRARVPKRMHRHMSNGAIQQFFNTGVKADGVNIGWPQCKQAIPLDFSQTLFPGGYPNDAGVNIIHDDFFGGRCQPETRALLDLAAAEKPDLIATFHTGVPGNNYFIRVCRPLLEPGMVDPWEGLYRHVHTRLAQEGLQSSRDPAIEADPAEPKLSPFNLQAALNLHCGALVSLVESPCHAFDAKDRQGNPTAHTPQTILDAHLCVHREHLRYLLETGGRIHWAPGPWFKRS